MQGLWSRAAPSQSTCRCVSCLSTTATGVTSRSTTAASKRRLRIGNSVTALYTSIFAVAALADAKAKTQRRNDWEEKIAAVKAEVNELVDEEQRLMKSLQSRRSPRGIHRLLYNGGLGITSSLPPMTQLRTMSSQPTRSFHTDRRLINAASAEITENFAAEEEITYEDDCMEDIEDMEARHTFFPSWVLQDPMRVKAIQKLALRQLAIRMLLRPTIAHRYSGLPVNYTRDFDVPQINVPSLLEELNKLRRRITELRTSENSEYDDLVHELVTLSPQRVQKECKTLDAELQQDLQLFMSRQMSLEEALLRTSENLLNSVDPDRTNAFRNIIIAFSQARQNDLTELLLRTILPHRFYLSTSLITTIMVFFRKSKNLKDFDLFLRMLTGEGWSANLGALAPYTHRKVNGLDVVVPPMDSNSVLIYSELITCALRFNQPDRADAWLQAARRVGFFDNFNTLFCYIKFYSIRQDWEKGSAALKRAVTYLVSSTGLEKHHVERLVVLMAHLCDSCGRKDVSQALISAAMDSGFDPCIPSVQEDVDPISDPNFVRWAQAAQSAPKENAGRPLWQKCSEFAHTFGNYLNDLETSHDDTRTQKLASHAACYAQNAMRAGLSGDSSTSKNAKIKDSALSSSSPSEVAELKNEVAQLRELVFELRKHHIQASFKKDNSYAPSDFTYEEHTSHQSDTRSHAPTPTSETQDPSATPRSVEFHKVAPKPGRPKKSRKRSVEDRDLFTPRRTASQVTA
ncbi:hypothetical protein N7507_008364 [Penicillium longicatenatum]|nr:hypothetical protein N7507_008364 [Penicillium longicatenatum]